MMLHELIHFKIKEHFLSSLVSSSSGHNYSKNQLDECDDEFDNEFDNIFDDYDEVLYRRKYNKIRIYEATSA
jgi:hypothetical protein